MQLALVLGPADHARPLTAEEYDGARWQEGYHYELIHGKLYVSPLPDLPQNWLEMWLFTKVFHYATLHREIINYVTPKSRIFLPAEPEETRPEPDLAAYHNFPLDTAIADMDWRNVSPLLVGEVLSEGDVEKDLVRNVELYLQVPSIREYWIVDPRPTPDHPTLRVYRRRGNRWQRPIEVEPGGTYATRLLPGFLLTVDPRS